MHYIEHFIKDVEAEKQLTHAEVETGDPALLCIYTNITFPEPAVAFYSRISYVKLAADTRTFEIFPIGKQYFLQPHYLAFSSIGDQVICFDTSQLNHAQQWNIVHGETGFVITQTLGSYLSNKCWAWLRHGRSIWKNEWD